MRTAVVVMVMALTAYVAGAAPGWASRGAVAPTASATARPDVEAPAAPSRSGPASYADAVNTASPCVVTIIPEIHIAGGDLPAALAERLDDQPKAGTVCKGIGSGVIVRADGHILTNNHVVEFADSLSVVVPGYPEPQRARVVGTDPDTDLAVIKIDLREPLPAIALVDSDGLRIGDVVLALGNPFGIGPTVSLGIVSATGRGMGTSDLEDFVQTDAPINLGCSGGALVDAGGRLVGINTAIFSPRGTNIGIGFAISSNLAASICDRLIDRGKVERGRLGLTVRALAHDERTALAAEQRLGTRVERVEDEAPAAAAGVKVGDVVLAVDGVAAHSPQHLQLLVAAHRPGDRIELTVLRAGEPLHVRARLGERQRALPADKDRDEAATEPAERMRAVKTAFPL